MLQVDQRRIRDERLGIVTDSVGAGLTGGEQAANVLQPTGSSRHPTTLDAKVTGRIAASPLVTRMAMLVFTAMMPAVAAVWV